MAQRVTSGLASGGFVGAFRGMYSGFTEGPAGESSTAEQLEEQKASRKLLERQTQVAEQTLEVLRRTPRSGASAAAAAPNVQRQGR
jgi:hypothetical protein